MRVGRNDLCPCGSGKKFKRCHLLLPPIPLVRAPEPEPSRISPKMAQEVQRMLIEQQRHRELYGDIRPIIWLDFSGYRFVIVRNRTYYSKKWRFFTDFLFE